MGRRLASNVHVWHEGKSEFVVLEKGTEVPEWAEELVTNPKAVAAEVAENAEGESGEESDEPKGYDDLKNDELKALLKDRELPISGNHADLVARLVEFDAENAEGESGEESDTSDTEE